MYGLVNLALLDFVAHRAGADTALLVARLGGAPPEGFLRMNTYPPGTTARLVKAVCQETGIPADTLLRDFGAHWVGFAMRMGYGELFHMFGRDLPTFLANLNGMHARLAGSHPGMEAPSFTVGEVGPDSLRLEYESHREGLTPFVEGLVTGIGPMFELDVRVTKLSEECTSVASGAVTTRAAFRVEFSPVHARAVAPR